MDPPTAAAGKLLRGLENPWSVGAFTPKDRDALGAGIGSAGEGAGMMSIPGTWHCWEHFPGTHSPLPIHTGHPAGFAGLS